MDGRITRRRAKTIVAALSILLFSGAAGVETVSWWDPPPLVLEQCVGVSRSIAPNPLSSLENDFLAVTAYEERSDSSGEVGGSGRYVNMYLVHGLLVLPGISAGLLHETHLIVTQWLHDVRSGTKTEHQWVFSDMDRDGSLDRLFFQKVVKDAGDRVMSLIEVRVPPEVSQRMQSYFNEAREKIQQKTDEDSGRTCLPV